MQFDSPEFKVLLNALEEVEEQTRARALEIVEASIAMKKPELAAFFVRSGLPVSEVIGKLSLATSRTSN
jgi:hypothetical protein